MKLKMIKMEQNHLKMKFSPKRIRQQSFSRRLKEGNLLGLNFVKKNKKRLLRKQISVTKRMMQLKKKSMRKILKNPHLPHLLKKFKRPQPKKYQNHQLKKR